MMKWRKICAQKSNGRESSFMSAQPDPRYEQKVANYTKALKALEKSVTSPISEPRDLSGIIQDFEIMYELSWKTLKAFLEMQGHESGPAKEVFSKAYQLQRLDNPDTWLAMIDDRNLTVHTYDEKLATSLCDRIRSRYVPAFQALL